MPVWSKVKDEFQRAPIATLSAPGGVIVGLGGIVIAYLQFRAAGPSIPMTKNSVEAVASELTKAGGLPPAAVTLMILAVFLTLTPSLASFSRITYKLNGFVAVFISVPIAVLSIFLNTMNTRFLGYAPLTETGGKALQDLLFYGTVLLFIAIAGRAPLVDYARMGTRAAGSEVTSEDAIGTVALGAFLIVIWALLVGWGQRQMIAAFPI